MSYNTLSQEKNNLIDNDPQLVGAAVTTPEMSETAAIAESEPGTFRYSVEQGQVSETQMVEHLRNNLADEATPELIKDMSDVMHAMVKGGIKEAGANPEQTQAALRMLEVSQPGSRIAGVQVTDTAYGAVYHRNTRNMTVSLMSANSQLKDVGGIAFKHPADARLLAAVQVVGHESGHARNNGMADYIDSKHPRPAGLSYWSPTARHLHAEPRQALTGNKEADHDIHEEREAQGYAAIGLTHMMRVMGYDEADIQTYLAATDRYYQDPTTGKHGHNQLDVFRKVTSDKAPHQLVDPKASLQQRISGGLGYARPLPAEAVIDYLAEAEPLAAEAQPEPTAEEWYQEVKKLHNGQPSESLRGALAERRKVVRSERRRFAAKVGAGVGAVALSAYAILGLWQGLEDADARQQHKPVPTHNQPLNSSPAKPGSIPAHK
jgi:hypothetical protein